MSDIHSRIEAVLSARGKTVNWDARRTLVDLEDQADGNGPYISRWDVSLGEPPTEAEGFSIHELHRVAK